MEKKTPTEILIIDDPMPSGGPSPSLLEIAEDIVRATSPKTLALVERHRRNRSRSVVGRQAEAEAWKLAGEGKMEVKDIPDFIAFREREARVMKTAALSLVPNMNRQQRRALAAQARKTKS